MNTLTDHRITAYISLSLCITAWVVKACPLEVQSAYLVVPSLMTGLLVLKSSYRPLVFCSWALGLILLGLEAAYPYQAQHQFTHLMVDIRSWYRDLDPDYIRIACVGGFMVFIFPVAILRPLLLAYDKHRQARMPRGWFRR